ncbi:hypothetical protein Tco_0585459 [Tanacetum coccineum]
MPKEVPCSTKSCCNQKQTTNKNSAKKPNDDLSEDLLEEEACDLKIRTLKKFKIKEMNEESKDPKKKRLKKRVVNETLREEDTTKVHHQMGITLLSTELYCATSGMQLLLDLVLHIFDRQVIFLVENNQQEWEIFRWRLYKACGICILELKDGTVIYMLVERRYPLSKELLQRMLDLGLEVEEESTAALHLVRFIKQQLNEE